MSEPASLTPGSCNGSYLEQENAQSETKRATRKAEKATLLTRLPPKPFLLFYHDADLRVYDPKF
jgi:hypothetical protein